MLAVVPGPAAGKLRTAELAAALSIATDLGGGQPLEHALRTCVLSVRLAEQAGLDEEVAADAYYVALLHASGCTSDAHEAAQLYGDDIAPRADWSTRDAGNPADVIAFLARNVGRTASPTRRAAALARALATGKQHAAATFAMHCEVAQRIAGRLACAPGVARALGFVFERWDGQGFPGDARAEQLPLAVRVLHVCHDACVFDHAAGSAAASDVIRRRRGAAYDPELADVLCSHAPALLGGLGEASVEAALAAEPGRPARLEGDQLDEALAAVGDFADLKAPCFVDHARSVS